MPGRILSALSLRLHRVAQGQGFVDLDGILISELYATSQSDPWQWHSILHSLPNSPQTHSNSTYDTQGSLIWVDIEQKLSAVKVLHYSFL